MKKDISELFIYIDDFCKQYQLFFQTQTLPAMRKPTRIPGLTTSEIMTIVLLFHQSPAKNFKFFYKNYLQLYKSDFPNLPSHNRFIELQQQCLGYFHALLMILCAIAKHNGLSYLDSTPIPVCHNKRIYKHKVFNGLAAKSKSTMGWFFGFKLHLVINEKGELLNAMLTPGNVDDRVPVRQMTAKLTGVLYRSYVNGFIHIFSTLVAYVLKSKKPAIKLENLIPN